jgi:hypothetical protein
MADPSKLGGGFYPLAFYVTKRFRAEWLDWPDSAPFDLSGNAPREAACGDLRREPTGRTEDTSARCSMSSLGQVLLNDVLSAVEADPALATRLRGVLVSPARAPSRPDGAESAESRSWTPSQPVDDCCSADATAGTVT